MAPVIGLPFNNHWYVEAAVDVSATLPPKQKDVGPPAVITGFAGIGLMVTFTVF